MQPPRSGIIALVLVSTFILAEAGAAPSRATGRAKKARTERVAELPYDVGVGGITEPHTAYVCLNGGPLPSCVEFPTALRDRAVSVKIADATGLPVPAVVEVHSHDAEGESSRTPICGETVEPLPVHPGVAIAVTVNVRDLSVPCAAAGTKGVVTATFSRT